MYAGPEAAWAIPASLAKMYPRNAAQRFFVSGILDKYYSP